MPLFDARTHEKIITSLSRPWNASVVLKSTLLKISLPYLVANRVFISRSWPLYGVIMPIFPVKSTSLKSVTSRSYSCIATCSSATLISECPLAAL